MEIKKKLKPAIFAGILNWCCKSARGLSQHHLNSLSACGFLRVGKMGKIAPQKARYSLGYISRLVRGFLM
jgi:hypothetical protein